MKKTIILILAIIYFISPIDVIPEAIFGPIGYVDDFGLLLLVLKLLTAKVEQKQAEAEVIEQ
jgi:uncharacterized membrane protein YkvA (DUF1232 family)